MKIRSQLRINSKGFGHIELVGAILVIAVITLVGVRVIAGSHAATLPSNNTAGVTAAYMSTSVSKSCPDIASVYVPPSDPTVQQQNPQELTPGTNPVNQTFKNLVATYHPKFAKSISCKLNPNSSPSSTGVSSIVNANSCLGNSPYVCPEINWSGYGNNYSNIYGVSMTWNVPQINGYFDPPGSPNTVPDGWSDSSIWAGIGGGISGSELIQAGTEQDAYCEPNTTCYDQYDAWYEVVPGEAEVMIKNMSVHPGDPMFVQIENLASSNQVAFTVCDFAASVDKCVTPVQNMPHPSGNGAEWIVERPEVNSAGKANFEGHLANYGTVSINNATELINQNGSWSPMGSGTDIAYNLTDCAGNQIAGNGYFPTPGSYGFQDKWIGYGSRSPWNYDRYDTNPNDCARL